MLMGGLAQAFFSLVVAISSTDATRALSVCPVKRLIFHTRACFLASYLALPAPLHQAQLHNCATLQMMALPATLLTQQQTTQQWVGAWPCLLLSISQADETAARMHETSDTLPIQSKNRSTSVSAGGDIAVPNAQQQEVLQWHNIAGT